MISLKQLLCMYISYTLCVCVSIWKYKISDFAYVYDEVGTGREKKNKFYLKAEFSEYLCLSRFFFKLLRNLPFSVWNRNHPFNILFYHSFFYLYRVAQLGCTLVCYDLLFCPKQQNYWALKADVWGEEVKKEMFIPPHFEVAPPEIWY